MTNMTKDTELLTQRNVKDCIFHSLRWDTFYSYVYVVQIDEVQY